jgi:hypothetical protein
MAADNEGASALTAAVYNSLDMKLRGQPVPGVDDRATSVREEAAFDIPLEYCPNCSAKLVGQSCKLKCPRCGYFLSCSDYY